ncbi:MAG: UDP-N-acetylmuramate--L-alanine ligase [Gammaproteobacteria bacterium]|nr:MAG: UDP-N-acetylmuramate--L-alanine ligase [Gammaproteobacteria bacterium]
MISNNRFYINKMPSFNVKSIYFVGIGGIGMSGIAQVLLNLGFKIYGSDIQGNKTIEKLKNNGAIIYNKHRGENIKSADVVVISSAITNKNPEIISAKKLKIPIIPRAQMLAELMRFSLGVAVSGTHGKTTTTSLIAQILNHTDLDPTYVIGGVLNNTGSNAKLGRGAYLIAEADESDASFLYLHPMIAIVTNIDADHLSTYGGSFEKLKQTFVKFLHQVPFYGTVILCIDNTVVKNLISQITKPILTYGFADDADYKITNLRYKNHCSYFDLQKNNKIFMRSIKLPMPGEHNVQNATAAIALADLLEIDKKTIKNAIGNFNGINRRFDVYGNVKLPDKKITLINDYAHHPTEIAATIKAATDCYADKRLVVVFQPHRYSRTQELLDDFSSVLSTVDILLISEVYAASEKKIEQADGRHLCQNIRARGITNPIFIDDISNMRDNLAKICQDQDVVLCIGAGDISVQVQKMVNL